MPLVYDTEELTVTRRIANFTVQRHVTRFGVRGRTGRIVSGFLFGEDRTALLTESGDYLLY
jgi:hypothetical protein